MIMILVFGQMHAASSSREFNYIYVIISFVALLSLSLYLLFLVALKANSSGKLVNVLLICSIVDV